MAYLVLKSAEPRIIDIYKYTLRSWGKEQADSYIDGLFATFEKIADKQITWRNIPADFEVHGYFCRYQKHFIYFKELSSGEIGIVSVLHERMHQIDRFQNDFGNLGDGA
jgi:toxin ParE1/3/4